MTLKNFKVDVEATFGAMYVVNNAKEKKIFKILSVVMSLLMFVISLLLKWAGFNILSVAVSFGIIMCAVVAFLRWFQILIANINK